MEIITKAGYRSDPSSLVVVPGPLKRNSTIVRTSTDVFAWYVGIDRVRIEMRVCRVDFRRDRAHLHVLSDDTHPFLDRDLPALPDELADSYHTGYAHATHQYNEYATNICQAQLVRC